MIGRNSGIRSIGESTHSPANSPASLARRGTRGSRRERRNSGHAHRGEELGEILEEARRKPAGKNEAGQSQEARQGPRSNPHPPKPRHNNEVSGPERLGRPSALSVVVGPTGALHLAPVTAPLTRPVIDDSLRTTPSTSRASQAARGRSSPMRASGEGPGTAQAGTAIRAASAVPPYGDPVSRRPSWWSRSKAQNDTGPRRASGRPS